MTLNVDSVNRLSMPFLLYPSLFLCIYILIGYYERNIYLDLEKKFPKIGISSFSIEYISNRALPNFAFSTNICISPGHEYSNLEAIEGIEVKGEMKNIEMRVEGDTLTIVVDLKQEFGLSSSGKSITVASTEGNVSVPEREEIKIGLNIYRPRSKSDR